MTPNPGSDDAMSQGCCCPVLDNNHGWGSGPFWVRTECPLHWSEQERVTLPASSCTKVGVVPYYTNVEMIWEDPAEFYESCVGKGWTPLLVALTKKLFYLGWDGRLTQVKEKFGTLSFYWMNNIPGILGEIAQDCVDRAEKATAQVCQTCGDSAQTRGNGWLVTLCTKHWEEYQTRG